MTKIKLCGMMRPADVIAAEEQGADYIGFVLTAGFRRSLTLDAFRELESFTLNGSAKKVGVFVNEPIENIAGLYADRLDLIQLHGSEDGEYIRSLREQTGKPIVKAFTVRSEADIEAAGESTADYVLLDSGTGTGKTFDHSLIKSIERPFFLAGGLNSENVGAAVKALQPFAVDASSGIETDGIKDKNKMAAFVSAVRRG